MVVGAGDDADPVTLRQQVLQRVLGPAAALGVADVGERRAVVLGVAPFRVDLEQRRDLGIAQGEVRPAMSQPVGRMMRDHDAAAFARESLQSGEIVEGGQLGIQIRKENVVVAAAGGMPLIPGQRDELPRRVEFAGQFQHLGPARAGHRETVDPLVGDGVLVLPDVVPVRVRGEGEEVQVLARDLVSAPERALRVADVAVVVQVAEVVAVGFGPASAGTPIGRASAVVIHCRRFMMSLYSTRRRPICSTRPSLSVLVMLPKEGEVRLRWGSSNWAWLVRL